MESGSDVVFLFSVVLMYFKLCVVFPHSPPIETFTEHGSVTVFRSLDLSAGKWRASMG